METLLDRFSRYVKVETTAVEKTTDYPSSKGQLELGKMLVGELKELGVEDAAVDEWGIVMGTVPGTTDAPTIAWLAHMDTSPDASGKDVKPIIHENYDGKDIVLPGDTSKVIKVEDVPELKELKGKTIITSDGTTLLGADDKAGIAVIMTTIAKLMADRSIQHGPIRIVFSCDEEVGRGADHLDIKKINASAAYTLDGESAGLLENETFSADMAEITVTGYNVHPGLAHGKMINAIRLAGTFLDRMPKDKAPETTSDRQGFLHPYTVDYMRVDEAKFGVLLRSFDSPELDDQAKILEGIAASIKEEHPKVEIKIDRKRQYRNMADHMAKEPRAVGLAQEAMKACGIETKLESIRGGTDGSRLSEMGLPTPNISTGMHNFHSPLEFACVEQMESSIEVLMQLAQLWGKEKA